MTLQAGTVITFEKPKNFHQIRLIGIGGKLRSGKDTVADYLVEKYGWVKMGMSDPLDEALRRENPYVRVEPDEPGNKNKSAKYLLYSEIRESLDYVTAKTIVDVRRLLQNLGTEVGRDLIGPNTWVNVADNTIFDHLADGKSVIVTGIRFPNELMMINKYEAGQTWYVKRPSAEREAKANTGSHGSEVSVSDEDFTVVLNNNKTLKALYDSIDTILGG